MVRAACVALGLTGWFWTAIAVYGALELARLGGPWLVADVFAAIVTALWVSGIADVLAPPFDRALARWLAALL